MDEFKHASPIQAAVRVDARRIRRFFFLSELDGELASRTVLDLIRSHCIARLGGAHSKLRVMRRAQDEHFVAHA